MGASIFNMLGAANNVSGLVNQVQQIKGILGANNPEQVALNLMQRNPQFSQFVNQCKGKSVDEICSMYGLDASQIKSALKGG